jgi:molybdate transport system substrate-binding protein
MTRPVHAQSYAALPNSSGRRPRRSNLDSDGEDRVPLSLLIRGRRLLCAADGRAGLLRRFPGILFVQARRNQEEAMRNFSFATAAVALLWALAPPAGAQAAEIALLAAAAVQEPLEAVVHAFEHDTGNKVAMTFGSVGAIQNRLKAGANADVVILSTALAAAAEKDGAARAGSRAVIGRVEIGVAVRDGTAAPDISTADTFKKTLLAAKSVSYTDPAGGGTAAVFVAGLLDRLGIADAIKGKSLKFNTGREVVAAVVKGDAEIGIGFTSEFVTVKGVKVVGALPKEIEFVNEYSAYVPAKSAAADTAQALLAYLARGTSRDIFKAAGAGL